MAKLMEKRPSCKLQVAKVFELSEKERSRGLLDGWFTKEEMDRKYGRGNWRASARHAILQGAKWRLTDNGKLGQHHLTYAAEETTHTTCMAAGVAVAKAFGQ